jgi:gliding-associated putative ABC transporter substrate-binding component GldG
MFFKYGFRLDPVLALDLVSTRIGIVTGSTGGKPNISMVPFPYHVMAVPEGDHPIIKNLDPVDLRFPSVIETVNDEDPSVKKTLLLSTSNRSRRQRLPSPIDLDAQKYEMDLDRFNENDLPLAYLLEGSFTSPYANRLSRENEQNLRAQGMDFKGKSSPTSMIIIADGDVLANGVSSQGYRALGINPWEKFQYANKALMLNAIEYLMNPDGVIAARGKDVKLRLIDKEAASLTPTNGEPLTCWFRWLSWLFSDYCLTGSAGASMRRRGKQADPTRKYCRLMAGLCIISLNFAPLN